MKLKFFSTAMFAGLFLSTMSFGQINPNAHDDSIVAFFAEAFAKERQAENAGENLTGDTVEIVSGVDGDKKIIRCWWPRRDLFDLIVANVETVIHHEVRMENDSAKMKAEDREVFRKAKKGMQDYLRTLKECRKNRYNFLSNAFGFIPFSTTEADGSQSILGDAGTYRQLKNLALIVNEQKALDLLKVQDYLITRVWGIHPNHTNGMYVPIISAERCAQFIDEEGKSKSALASIE